MDRQLIPRNGPIHSQREIAVVVNGNSPLPHDPHLLFLGQSYMGSQLSITPLPGEGGLRTKGGGYMIPVFEGT